MSESSADVRTFLIADVRGYTRFTEEYGHEVAARLCGRAHGGEVLLSEGTSRLAGRLPGISYVDRGRAHLKNISEPIHTFAVRSEREPATANRWVLMFFGRPGRTFGWKLGMAVVLIAAITAGAV